MSTTCPHCQTPLVKVQTITGWVYSPMHSTSKGGMAGPPCAEATFSQEVPPYEANYVRVDPCPTCGEPDARFQGIGTAAEQVLRCPKGCPE